MLAEPSQLALEALVGFDDVVQRARHLAGRTGPGCGQACGKVPSPDGREDAEHYSGVDRVAGYDLGCHVLGLLSISSTSRLSKFMCACYQWLMGTQNSTRAPAPGSLSIRHLPPASWARSRIVTRPRWPGM